MELGIVGCPESADDPDPSAGGAAEVPAVVAASGAAEGVPAGAWARATPPESAVRSAVDARIRRKGGFIGFTCRGRLPCFLPIVAGCTEDCWEVPTLDSTLPLCSPVFGSKRESLAPSLGPLRCVIPPNEIEDSQDGSDTPSVASGVTPGPRAGCSRLGRRSRGAQASTAPPVRTSGEVDQE